MATRLTKETKSIITKNNTLAAMVSDALGIQSSSLHVAFFRNTTGLISYPVLKIISDYTGKQISELIEEYDEDERATVELGDNITTKTQKAV